MPIPLDEEDVLEFVMGDEEPAPAAEEGQEAPAAKTAPPKKEEAPAAKTAPAAKKPEAEAKPQAAAKQAEPAPAAEDGGADDAIAEFLMDIELDEDDQR